MLRHFKAHTARDGISSMPKVVTYRMIDWPDGSTTDQAFIMPPETLALRAGEYGLDPSDTQLLLDVVLHESFIVYPDGEHPLWTAGSIAEAREQHLDTVADERHRHEERMRDEVRPKTYPGPELHRASLMKTAELSPVYRGVVDAGRRMARTAWMRKQQEMDADVPMTDGRLTTAVELTQQAADEYLARDTRGRA